MFNMPIPKHPGQNEVGDKDEKDNDGKDKKDGQNEKDGKDDVQKSNP